MIILWATTFYNANAKQNSLSEIGHFMIILWATTFYNTKANPKHHKVLNLIRQGAAMAVFCKEF